MNGIANGWTITKQSFAVLQERKTLLVFPFLGMLVPLVIFFGAVAPLVFGVTVLDIASALPALNQPFPESDGAGHAAESGIGPLAAVGLYFLWVFVATFLNVAAISEILNAVNGNKVSIARGFKLAGSRIQSIVAWTLFSGTVGIAIRLIGERLPFAARWIESVLGIGWSVATVFVVPILIREQGTTNPLRHLKVSAGLVRGTWGKGLIGLVAGPLLLMLPAGVLIGAVAAAGVVAVAALTSSVAAAAVAAALVLLVAAGYFALVTVLYKICYSGLYVYATEGVPPRAFAGWELEKNWTHPERKS